MSASATFVFQTPVDGSGPVYAETDLMGLRFAVVSRENLPALPSKDWAVPGVYVLFAPGGADWWAYVGQASTGHSNERGLLPRVSEHLKSKDEWTTAVLLRRSEASWMNRSRIAWLERHVHDRLKTGTRIALANKAVPPGEGALAPHELDALEGIATQFFAFLHILGLPLEAAPDETPPALPGASPQPVDLRGRAFTLSLIGSKKLRVGETLYFRASGKTATVLEDGRIAFDGNTYDSLSEAGHAASPGWKSSNGKRDWHVDRDGKRVAIISL